MRTAQLELMVFSELYDRKRALLKEDQLLFVVGKVRYDEFAQRLSISADELMDLTEARARAAARLRIEVDGAGDVARLRDALIALPDHERTAARGCRIVVNYSNGTGSVDIPLPEDWRVRPEDRLVAELAAQPRVRRAYFKYPVAPPRRRAVLRRVRGRGLHCRRSAPLGGASVGRRCGSPVPATSK